MSFSVDVRLGEVSATTSLFELSASVTISGGLLRSIPFSANKDTELDFADTITFSVDNPDNSIFYYWEVENENGYKRAQGQSVKQDYAAEGSYDVNLIASNTNSIEGVNFKQDFVKVGFTIQKQLLDEVPGAAAAYSIRLLRQDYSDGLLRVRAVDGNGTDQGEADVQDLPLADGRYIDLNSPIENLDSTAQGRGLSNSDTLGDLVDSGGSNYDGFVPKWYEQSPNARHAEKTTASEQPQIVDSGNLITENGKPALDFDGTDDYFSAPFNVTLSEESVFGVFNIDFANSKSNGRFVTQRQSNTEAFNIVGNIIPIIRDGTNNQITFLESSSGFANSSQPPSDSYIHSFISDGNGTDQFFNGNLKNSESYQINADLNVLVIGSGNTLNRNKASSCKASEFIIYPNSQRANKSQIESEIDGFYQIPNF